MATSYFKTLAQDLLNLEINTIIKPDMIADKMPSSRRQALYDLSADYSRKLQELGVREPVYWKYAGMRSFGELRDRAKEGIRVYETEREGASPEQRLLIEEKIKMLERIQFQSSQVVGMFKAFNEKVTEKIRRTAGPGYADPPDMNPPGNSSKMGGKEADEHMDSMMWNNDIGREAMNKVKDLDLTPDQIALIRKARDIGTEKILLQTVIQLDGDVTTRIAESMVRDMQETILRIHNDSILTATTFWSHLVRALGEIAGKAFNVILGKP